MTSLRTKVFQGLAWQGAGKVTERLLRFAINVVLARILVPDDFGIFAAVLLPLAAIDAISYLASDSFIIHADSGAKPRVLKTVFTVNNIRGVILSLCLLPLAPLLAMYFDRPQLSMLFMVAAIQPFLVGFESPGLHALAKNMQFARIALTRLGAVVVGAIAALVWAISDPSPWALLGGQLLSVAGATIGSWIVAPIWPAWGFDREAWSELKRFALGAAGTPLLIMLINQAPALILGRLESLDVLGVFAMNARLAELPVYLTLAVAGSVLIPAYSSLQNDQVRLRRVWLKAWAGVGFLAVPVAVLFAWMGGALPEVVWGSEYVSEQPLMPILALCGLLSSFLAVTGPLFWGVGRPSIDRKMQAARVAVVFILGLLLTLSFQSAGLAWSLAAGLLVALAVACPNALRLVNGRGSQLALATLPGAAGGAIVALPLLVVDFIIEPSGWIRVLTAVGVGGLFCLCVGGAAANKRLESQKTP